MKTLRLLALAVSLPCIVLLAQTPASNVKMPTAAEATAACVTLQRLISVAQSRNQAADAAALVRAYRYARLVADGSGLIQADEYVAKFAAANPSLVVELKPGGGFKNRTIEDSILELKADPSHQTAILLLDKSETIHWLPSAMDAEAIHKALVEKGAVMPGVKP